MTAYQSGIGKFEALDSQVLAISTDFVATLSHWSKELDATFPLLSDHDGAVSKLYGVYMPANGLANRATFVVDPEGKIANIIEGSEAIDVTKAETACSRVKKKE